MITADEADVRRRAIAEQAGPFLRDVLRPRFARVLGAWLDADVPGKETYTVHAELRAMRGLLREYAAETAVSDPAEDVMEDM